MPSLLPRRPGSTMSRCEARSDFAAVPMRWAVYDLPGEMRLGGFRVDHGQTGPLESHRNHPRPQEKSHDLPIIAARETPHLFTSPDTAEPKTVPPATPEAMPSLSVRRTPDR